MARTNRLDSTRDTPQAPVTTLKTQIKQWDVLLGRGKHVHYHTGNVAYRAVIKAKAREYVSKECVEKDVVARSIIRSIILSKVKQALRDTVKNDTPSTQKVTVSCEARKTEAAEVKSKLAGVKKSARRKEAKRALHDAAKKDYSPGRKILCAPRKKQLAADMSGVGEGEDACRPKHSQNGIAQLHGVESGRQQNIELGGQGQDSLKTVEPLNFDLSREIGHSCYNGNHHKNLRRAIQPLDMDFPREISHTSRNDYSNLTSSTPSHELSVLGFGMGAHMGATRQPPDMNLPVCPTMQQLPWRSHLLPITRSPALHPTQLLQQQHHRLYPRLEEYRYSRTMAADQALLRMSQNAMQHHGFLDMD